MATSSVSKREVTVTLALEEKEAVDLLNFLRSRVNYQITQLTLIEIHKSLFNALNKAGIAS